MECSGEARHGDVPERAIISSVMPSERIQRRIDRLLDPAEVAADAQQWPAVRPAGRSYQGLGEVAMRRGNSAEAMQVLDAAPKLFEQYGAKPYLDQVIAKKLELRGVGTLDGSDGVTIVAPEPGETMPLGGAKGN